MHLTSLAARYCGLMRAVLTHAPGDVDQLYLGEVSTPEVKPTEVLVKVVASGINRADVLQRQGHYPPPAGTTEIIGLEVSGHIAQVGSQVSGWKTGDPCVALLAGGGYAEYVSVPAGQVIPPPVADLVDAAALVEVPATVVSNFDVVGLRANETVLIHGGAGGIGTFAIQYAKALGARVATTAGNEAKLDFCRNLGADFAFDYHGDWVSQFKAATDGLGADVILDIIGAKYLEANLAALAHRGRQVTIGLQGGVKGTLNLGLLLRKQATITATSLRFRPESEKVAITGRVAEKVWPLLNSGAIQLPPIRRFGIEDVAAAHEHLVSADSVGKMVCVW